MIAHREEILARPARSWFQTPKEKMAVQQAARAQNPTSRLPSDLADADGDGAKRKRGKGGDGGDGDAPAKPKVKRDKYAGMTRKRRRALQRNEILEAEEKEGKLSLPNQKSTARGAKAAAKGGKLRQLGGSLREGEVGHDGGGDDEPRQKRPRPERDESASDDAGLAAKKKPSKPAAAAPASKKARIKPAAIKKKAAHSKPKFANRTKGRKGKR